MTSCSLSRFPCFGINPIWCLALAVFTALPTCTKAQKPSAEAAPNTALVAEQKSVPNAGTRGYGIPKCLYCPQPEFSDEAVKAQVDGTVLLITIITQEGKATDIHVAKKIGSGLDEKAVEALSTWRFTPALDPDGKPAAVRQAVEITFHLSRNVPNPLSSISQLPNPKSSTGTAQAHVIRGEALMGAHDMNGAISEYREALRLEPDNVAAHYDLGHAFEAQGDIDGAATEYRESIHLKPDLALAHASLGAVLQRKKDIDGALAEDREAIRLKPDFEQAHANLGSLLRAKGDFDEAIPELNEALRLNHDDAKAHRDLGLVLGGKREWDQSIAELREAVRLDPTLAEAHVGLGAALGIKGDWDGDIAELHEALRLESGKAAPDVAQLSNEHLALAGALMAKRDLNGAIPELREALQDNPNSAEAHYGLGVALTATGNKEEATRQFAEAQRLNPRFKLPNNASQQ